MRTQSVNQQYNPNFQKLDIYRMQDWNRKLLDAVLQSKGIKEAAQKHDITVYQNDLFGSYNIFVSKPGFGSDIFNIAGYKKRHNLDSAINKIKNFDAKQFDNFVNSRLKIKERVNQKLEKYNNELTKINKPEVQEIPQVNEKATKNGIWQRFLNFFK